MTESGLDTLNTNKIMAVIAKKEARERGEKVEESKSKVFGASSHLIAPKDIIDERGEQEEDADQNNSSNIKSVQIENDSIM